MKRIRNAAISAVCLLVFVAGAVAQQKDGQEEQREPVAGTATLGVTIAETELIAPGWRASKLIGSEVRNDKGEKIGSIDDLIVSPDGTLSVAVVNVGGFIDIAGRKVAIPVGQFQKLAAGKAVLRGATKDELKKLPEFRYTQ
jgi:sporulation protein YlmC with PRC-barrel domain